MNKIDFLQSIRRAETRVDLGGAEVVIRQLLVADQNAQRAFRESNADPIRVNAFLVARSLYAVDGVTRIFSDDDIDDVLKMPGAAFEKSLAEIMAINGWAEADPVKNS